MPRDINKKFVFANFLRTILNFVLIFKIMVVIISQDIGIQCVQIGEENIGNYTKNNTQLSIAADISTRHKSIHQNLTATISTNFIQHIYEHFLLQKSISKRNNHPRNYLHRPRRSIELIRHKQSINEESLVVVGHERPKPRREPQHHNQDADMGAENNLQISTVTDKPNPNTPLPPNKDIPPSSREATSVDRRGKQHQHLHRLQQLSNGNGVHSITGGNPSSVFATENNTVVMAQIGGTATLPCVVRKFNNGVVSWIRKQDYHLLTVGLTTYNADGRFLVEHIRHLQNWGLLIKHVQPSDEGLYECQVSTHPPTSIFVELKVTEASAFITGAPDLHLRSGSTLRLLCTLRQSTEPPAYVFWFHQHRMINYDTGVNVSRTRGGAGSLLVVPEADKSHNGNYTCSPSNAVPASINVHVLNATAEEQPAAMQHANTNSTSGVQSILSPKFTYLGNLTLLLIMSIIIFSNYYTEEYKSCVKNISKVKNNKKEKVKEEICGLKNKAKVQRICGTSKKCENKETLISGDKNANRDIDCSKIGVIKT